MKSYSFYSKNNLCSSSYSLGSFSSFFFHLRGWWRLEDIILVTGRGPAC